MSKRRSITPSVRREYEKFRREGEPASRALRNAKVVVRFKELEAQGRARLHAEPDEEGHDISYVETWGLGKGHEAEAKKRIREQVESEGVWFWQAQVKSPRRGKGYVDREGWKTVDGIGDVIGDVKGTGYDIDLMEAANEALKPRPRKSSKPRSSR